MAILKRSRNFVVQLPADPPLPHHTYGPKMISLGINIACAVGLRASETVLNIVFKWLGVELVSQIGHPFGRGCVAME